MQKFKLVLLAGLAITMTPVLALAGSLTGRADGWHRGWGMGQGWGFGHGPFGILWMVLFWSVVIALIVFAVRKFSRSTDGEESSISRSTPLEILQERYARGEIDEKEYQARKQVLTN